MARCVADVVTSTNQNAHAPSGKVVRSRFGAAWWTAPRAETTRLCQCAERSPFDQNVAVLREKIRRIDIDIEQTRLSIEVAIAGSIDRTIGLVAQRGAA
jgi:hypothetical protein